MGVTYSARLIVGFPVAVHELWQTDKDGTTCRDGHPQTDPTWRCCPQCGGPFKYTQHTTPTERFKELAGAEGVDKLWERWRNDRGSRGRVALYPCCAVHSTYTQDRRIEENGYILGEMLNKAPAEDSAEGEGPDALALVEIERAVLRRSALRAALAPDESVWVYSCLSIL